MDLTWPQVNRDGLVRHQRSEPLGEPLELKHLFSLALICTGGALAGSSPRVAVHDHYLIGQKQINAFHDSYEYSLML